MLRDFKFMRRNTGKNPNAEEAENVPVNPKDLSNHQSVVDPSRPPLNAIQDPAQTSTYISNLESSSMKVSQVERTPTKPKYKSPDTMMPFRTPEKQGAMSKNKCGRGQKSEYQSTSGVVESKEEGRVVTNAYTPRAARTVERGNSSYSQCNSTQSTPSKSVIKPPSSGYSLATVSRPPPTGRAFNFAALAKGIPSSSGSSTVVNTVEVPYFELKEDPSFWMEHNVQVLIRVRPLNSMEKSSFGFNRCLKQETSQCISWIGQPETRFTFDHVACEAIDQETLFRMVGLPMVENCLSGYNSCMFAYGQTGSGKTFTMLGEIEGLEVKPSPNRGMTPRIFEFLFARIRAEEESRRDERLKYNCKCSFLEIYNEQITDLLDPSSTNLMLREDMKKGVYVENLSEFEVHTVGDILQLLTQGSSNRKVAATNMNRESSRSHSVFTCVIESKWEKDSTTNFRFARLNLVDLAGSERQKSSGAEGERLKEAANINRSLSTLGHVIMVLVDVANGKLKHVPYRDSRLTFLLQDSLGGNSKTMIIANVSPSVCSAAETLNTLKFAQRAKLIQNNAIINEDSSGDVVVLKRQIQLLKEELSALKREKVTRSLSFGPAFDRDIRNKDEDSCNIWKGDEDNMLEGESCGVLRVSCKQLKSVEATLAGALRREQMAETSIKQLEAEIEQLNRLVSQREEDTRCSKMMLKFREDKIQRMESLLGGLISADDYLLEENTALTEEIQQLRARIDKNPEVTRFAVENIRLLEQVRRFQDFYEEGEREMLMTEVSELRKQLNASIDGNAWIPNHLDIKGSINDKENDLIQKELRRTLAELEESKERIASCLNDNTKLREELEELRSSLGATAFGTEELNCSSEVIKESIVEVPHSNNQSIPDTHRDNEEKSCRNHVKYAEDIMDLQLELDILKIILQEERLQRAETEKMVQSVKGELQSSRDTVVSITKEFEKLQDELKNAKLVIDALESQQIVSINEIEDLRISNIQYEELLKRKELEMPSGKEHSEREDSPLEAKFRKMHESLEKAKRLNKGYQSSLAVQASNDDETEEVRKQVEAETAEVIVCLQEELSLLQQEVHESKMKEIETSEKLALLKTEMEVMENNLHSRCEDNTKLSERLEHNEKELRTLSEAWEATTYEIEAILAGGHEALKDACDQIDLITTSTPHKPSWISEQFATMKKHIIEKELVTEELNQCLRDAIDKRNDVESMLRSLRGAALVMAETHQHECTEKDKKIILLTSDLNDKSSTVAELERLIKHGRDQLRKTSSCATAALVMVSRLSELNSDYQDSLIDKDFQLRELQEICTNNDVILQNQATTIDKAHEKNHSLQVELEASQKCCTEIRLQLSELEAIQVKLEESEEHKILEAQEKLKDLNSGVLTLKSCMNEYRAQSGDHHKGTTPEKSKCFAADECESRTGTRTAHDVIETSNCLSRAGTLKEQKINENSMGSERALKNVKSRDATIILLKKEIESALRSLEEVQAEMGKLRREKEEISLSEKHSRESIESLMSPAVLLQDAMDNFESDFKLKISSLDDKLVKMEDTIQESCSSWFQQRELLEAELDDAKVVADQKSIEASCIFEKFEEFQDTMKEADIMINELMIANEALKLNAQELRVRENNLTSERDTLLNDVQSMKLSNNLKDQNYEKLEKQHDTDFVTMKRMFLELEDAVSQVQTASNEEWASLSSDFLSMKSQLHEATKLIRSSLEEVWSEIIVKDCAVSVLHLCHMGILLETANGLNAENGLLHHGLCESNSVISELRDSNFRSKRELEMCRVLEGKLLTDIKKGFDRVSNQVDEAGELTLKLTSFEKKIQHLQFQEEAMLLKSNDMGSELATLMKELDRSNRDALASIMDQERSQKNIAEKYESREEHFLMELLAKDLESFILSSELKNMSLLKADVEATSIGFLEMIENFRKDMVLRSLDAYSCEFMLLDKEIECDLSKKEVEKAMKKHQRLLLELDGKSSAITQLETVNKALQQDVHLLKESVHSGESLKGALQQVMEEKKILSGQVQNLEFQYEQLLDKCENSKLEVAEMETVLAEMNATIESLRGNLETVTSQKDDLDNKILSLTKDLEMARAIAQENEQDVHLLKESVHSGESLKGALQQVMEEKKILSGQVQNLEFQYEQLLDKCENSELEVAEMETVLAEMNATIESLRGNLETVTSQRDDLDNKILSLTKDLEMARAIAQENETIAIEAREIAESHKLQAEEKEEEVKLYERSIQELEFTINVLQQKTDIIREDAERQHLQSEELELELQAVKGQLHDVQSNDINIRRHLEEKEKKLLDTLQRVQLLEREIGVRDDELSRCKAHIAELNVHAEAQACEYKQKFKALEAMVEQVKSEVPSSLSSNSSSNKLEKNASKSRGSGSPFKCIGLGLVQQMKSEKDEELTASRQRIEELEALVSSRQKEMLMLKARLASTESMTHDVMRDLLGVKLNMNSYATLMDNQQLHSLIEEAQHHNAEVQAKEHEVANLKLQIDEFIKERNGWLEEIGRKQADMMAARVALEKLRQQDQFHKTENDMLKRDNVNHKKRVMELEVEVKKLSGQQNIQQRIHHHAKIKDENNQLRSHNEDLSNKLKKTEATLSRVKDELAQYRAANGRNPYINLDEEQRLDRKLKESEEERLQLAQKLVGLCTSVLQAAGITRPTSEVSLSVAEAALEQLTNRTVSLEMELQDVKLKNRILDERSRLSDLRPQTSATASRANENRHAQNLVSQTPFLSALDR